MQEKYHHLEFINKYIMKFFKIFECKGIEQKFYLNDLQIQILTKAHDSLLPKLMSGQIRVKE
jgi:hypothetical protein